MSAVGELEVEAGGVRMVLRADRTLWLPEGRTLVVSDLHLGKAAVFRHHGLAVPEGDTERDLGRLSEAIGSCGAERLVIAGDFFHAPAAQSVGVLEAVRVVDGDRVYAVADGGVVEVPRVLVRG